MKCPYCGSEQTKVIDKRDCESMSRRRRECLKCEKRFTTYERVELDLFVVKKDGSREKFDREKLSRGVERAFEKLKIGGEELNSLIDDIEARVYRVAKDKDIPSSKIGEIVMSKLKRKNKVAYIRFAAVYREFADLDDFKEEIKSLK